MFKMFMSRSIIALVLVILVLTACSSGPEEATIVIEEPWARPGQMKMAGEGMEMESEGGGMAMPGTSAIFMTIRNDGREDDRPDQRQSVPLVAAQVTRPSSSRFTPPRLATG